MGRIFWGFGLQIHSNPMVSTFALGRTPIPALGSPYLRVCRQHVLEDRGGTASALETESRYPGPAFESTLPWPAADLIRYKIPASFMFPGVGIRSGDALALARELGPPSFFITMTSNPKWPEIVERLRPGQHFTDIPSVVCRAFHVRLQYLKAFMTHYFRRLTYIVTVVEFQKRGLPHSHILLKICKKN
jgi:hypothetical protein